VTVEQAWGFGMVKIREGILGLKGDHAQRENWELEIKALL
tara:strand:+ start:55169 stop:55288 length:120 start_codon:yes stop_codon:yes gene_type:complete